MHKNNGQCIRSAAVRVSDRLQKCLKYATIRVTDKIWDCGDAGQSSGPKSSGGAAVTICVDGGAAPPSNTMSPGARSIFVPSSTLIYRAWLQ